jgi:hypothetical protein
MTQATKPARGKSVPTPKAIMKDIVTPAGFTRTETSTDKLDSFRGYDQKWPVLVLESPDTRIEIWFSPANTGSWDLGSGHVWFDTAHGRRSFDRYGVDDSFHVPNPARSGGPYEPRHDDIVEVDGHLAKVTEVTGRERWPITVSHDGTVEAFTKRRFASHGGRYASAGAQTNESIREVIEERIPEARARIDRSESIPGIPFMVTPESKAQITAKLKKGEQHSFMPSGFGTGYVLHARRSPGAKAATKKTCDFFGVSPLWVSTFDAD